MEALPRARLASDLGAGRRENEADGTQAFPLLEGDCVEAAWELPAVNRRIRVYRIVWRGASGPKQEMALLRICDGKARAC